MDFTGRYQIPAPPEAVWAGLNDPNILAAAIPGCEALTRTGDSDFSGTVALKIGPMEASFKGQVTLSEMEPPHRLLLTGSGDGRDAGFASGGAEIVLTPKDGGTEITYKAGANIGGKMAQIGERLIDGAARQIADQFFADFAAQLTPKPAAPAAAPGRHSELWALGLVGVVAILIVFFLIVI
ncbi:MAG TPA: carbon monoxide dehydrogenase subunit G [Rhizomicrobium sp.]|nr:carbon monoxide dehydrogenase subunit G [Rhizomicrobium sp.]